MLLKDFALRPIFVLLCSAAALVATECWAVECQMSIAFSQPDVSHVGGKSPVWKDAQGVSALLFRRPLQVNTDGTQRSYSVEDFWGETKAINNLCNAMSDNCAGLKTSDQKRERRILTQKAMADQWPPQELKATRIDSQIIPFKNGRPCPEVNGYLVSATALQEPVIKDACDPQAYLDSLVVPAIVLPQGIRPAADQPRLPTGFDVANARLGDLIVAVSPSQSEPVYGVIGDLGPENKLGEASVAMNGALNNINRAPENYNDVTKHWVVNDATILIFPGTRDNKSPYLTRDRINHDAAAKFVEWGGGSLSGALDRLKTCSSAMGN